MLTTRRKIRIEWGDCDPGGIVYFPRYFEFFDACTSGLFEAVGLPKALLIKTYGIVGIPVVDVRASFSVASRFGDEVEIETSIPEWGRSSFRVKHRLLRDKTVAVEGWEKRVWVGRHPVDPDALKSRPIPRELINRFGAHRSDSHE